MVVHANHAAEIDCEVAAALERLRCAAVMLFNQSVLMRGVNDSHVILKQLSERLIDVGVTPYYLHLLDPVSGAAHYDVPHKEAVEMVNKLRDSMPGYAVPRLVREVPGESSKHWIH
jgi:L-lysine 2,3-aminomutase